MASGDVDSDAQPGPAGYRATPFAHLTTRAPQDPATELDDLATLFCDRDEAPRHQHAELGVVPTHERLHAEEAARAKVHDGLILDKEFLVGERTRDVRL